ncbi:uncharacterized protein LOC114536027 [Dendronephthya gigantea]|uniref:uncharacterized protein LOC114536027 n=1 Tax=Dendronephthya gigantea TaxID=151771 RepID=UPI001069B2C4|nr:uncharacterized protein LOC114536027 [Dendronephthya gigantea]
MAKTTGSVNNYKPKSRRQIKSKNKSKYFENAQRKSAKRAVKSISKQTDSEGGISQTNLPKLGPLSTAKDYNPEIFGKRLGRDFFDTPTEKLAVDLLGKVLCRRTDQGEILCGKIVETEAYLGAIDPACHAYGGKRTARNAPMYGPPGTAYVYFIYGMYHCFNISSKEEGACVLVRALEPLTGLTQMKELRAAKRKETAKPLKEHELANGPSKLCTALDINKQELNNIDMVQSKQFWVVEDASLTGSEVFTVIHTTRIGIDSYGKEAAQKLYRYYIFGNKHVSMKNKEAESRIEVAL